MFVYLAGPIDAVSHEDGTTWRESAGMLFAKHGNVACYSPAHAFQNVTPIVHWEQVAHINEAAITCSSLVFAFVSEAAFGTIREIEQARMLGLPVYVWSRNEDTYARLEESILAQDLILTKEKFLGDAIQFTMNHYEGPRELEAPISIEST